MIGHRFGLRLDEYSQREGSPIKDLSQCRHRRQLLQASLSSTNLCRYRRQLLEASLSSTNHCITSRLKLSRIVIYDPISGLKLMGSLVKVSKGAKIRNRYNQVPHLTQDTNGKVINTQLDSTNESQEVSPFPAGDHKAHINRRSQKHSKHKTEKNNKRSTKEVPPWNSQ